MGKGQKYQVIFAPYPNLTQGMGESKVVSDYISPLLAYGSEKEELSNNFIKGKNQN
ncbi:MAG: hypothetical protein SCALA701_11520 [Candidatus Scalindua sp.]|nr:hypothetical protein [Planctomycetota bacterium]GJQ58351.1 MAG: hypothetical protein SCALA701_11520 [Candidatus Scalindua sp.]